MPGREPTRTAPLLAVLLAAAGCAAPPARVLQDESPGPEAPPPEERAGPPGGEVPRFLQRQYEAEPFAGHLLETDVGGGDASVATDLAGVVLRTRFPATPTRVLGIETGYEWRDYRIEGESEDLPGSGDPLGDLHTVDLTLTWLQVLGDDWMRDWQVYARGTAQSSFEDGARFRDSISYGGLAVFGKAWSPALRLGFGVGGVSQLEEDPIVFPALQFVWTPNDDWRLELVGPKLEVERRLAETRFLALLLEYDFRGFRLREEGAANGGVLTDERLPLTLRFTQRLGKSSRFRIRGGIDLVRRLDFADAQGNQIDRGRTDPAPFAGFSLLLGI